MKVYISADIEGVAGVVHGDQIGPQGGGEYQKARLQMTREVNSVVEAALALGASEVLVNDGHANQRNILIEELHEDALLLAGSPKPLAMMEGIDASFDAAVFVGYHARAGTSGTMSHTMSGGAVANIYINGQVMGETALNAALAGHFGVPVVLVTGDNRLTGEAQGALGLVETVTVKDVIWHTAAKCIHPRKVLRMIREAAEKALSDISQYNPLIIPGPVTIDVEYLRKAMVEMAARVPGYTQVGELTLRKECADYLEAYRWMRMMVVG
ncbi:MAG TPA: peptidase M55 [Firmicutes bacterium]|nr:peptidase M55 [Bacillota bacterium]